MRCFQVVLQCSHEEWQTVLVAHGGLMAWLADAPPSHSLSSIDQEKKKKNKVGRAHRWKERTSPNYSHR